MPGAAAHLVANHGLDVGRSATVDQVSDVLFGADPDHDAQAVARRSVEQRVGRHRVRNADGVDAVRRHLREVPLHGREVVILVAARVGRKGAVGHAAHVQLFRSDEQELPGHARARGGRSDVGGPCRARRAQGGGAGGPPAGAGVEKARS